MLAEAKVARNFVSTPAAGARLTLQVRRRRRGNYVGYQTLAYMRPLRKSESVLVHDLKKGIGEPLRATYEHLVRADLPKRHRDLLRLLQRDQILRAKSAGASK